MEHILISQKFSNESNLVVERSPIAQETGIQSLVESYQRLNKWYLMPQVRFKGKVEQSRERSSALPYTLV